MSSFVDFLARCQAPELRAWRGERSLAVVFWLYGVAVSWLLVGLHALALLRGQVGLQQVLFLVAALYTLSILVAIWRCAVTASPFWGAVARGLTVAWAINTGLVLLFLQADLLVRLPGTSRLGLWPAGRYRRGCCGRDRRGRRVRPRAAGPAGDSGH